MYCFRQKSATPILLRINSESRTEALRIYKRVFGNRPLPGLKPTFVYLNPGIDSVLIRPLLEANLPRSLYSGYRPIFPQEAGRAAWNVVYGAILVRVDNFSEASRLLEDVTFSIPGPSNTDISRITA